MTSTAELTKISEALHTVSKRIQKVSTECGRTEVPRLVAVGKTKPLEAIKEAYDAGQRHFGENYVQELVKKSESLTEPDIKWHFIGPLQSNKAKMLVRVKDLAVVETIDRKKIADAVNKAATAGGKEGLRVMVQVNTSGEETKSGCRPNEAVTLSQYVVENCPALTLTGLMTIGKPETSEKPEAFQLLRDIRKEVAQSLGKKEEDLELSMGMSGDFEAAIRMGSTSVRVGSTIFGERDYSKKR